MASLVRAGSTTVYWRLAACSSACSQREPEAVQENILPTDIKATIIDMLHSQLEDPTNIRDAALSEPALKPVAGTTRYVVCFPIQSAGRAAADTMGIKNQAVIYYAGRPTQIISSTHELCGGVAYQPFPELQKLCRSVGCKYE